MSAISKDLATSKRSYRWFVAAVLAHIVMLVVSTFCHVPVRDEVGHFGAGMCHWQTGSFFSFRVNPPLVRLISTFPAAVLRGRTLDLATYYESPGLRNEIALGNVYIRDHKDWLIDFRIAQLTCIPFSVLGGYVIFRWATHVYGGAAGLFGAVLWFLSPTVLGLAPTIMPDVASASLGILANYRFFLWLQRPDRRQGILTGLTLGLAQLSKTTLLAFYPAFVVLLLLAKRRPSESRPTWSGFLGIVAMSILVLNLGYGFEGTGTSLSQYHFVSKTLSTAATSPAASAFDAVLVPLPRNYVYGIDLVKKELEEGFWCYLGGTWKRGGWWYFYLYAMAVKLPVTTLTLLLVAGLAGRVRFEELAFLLPAALIVVCLSVNTGYTHHLRYCLPAFPAFFLWASRCATFPRAWVRTGCVCLLAASAVSSLQVFPHSMSYFNELSGGSANGHAHLLYSNIDYGQDLMFLKRWMKENGVSRVKLAYFGAFNPRDLGIDFDVPSDTSSPGIYAISVYFLRGGRLAVTDQQGSQKGVDGTRFVHLLEQRATARVGYSMYVYEVPILGQ